MLRRKSNRRKLKIKKEEVCYKLKRHTEKISRIEQNLNKENKRDQC
jgi:hypothetical protein